MGTFVSVLIFAVGILVLHLLMQQKGGLTPPGPFGLPLLGYLPFMGSKPHILLQKLANIYGSIFSLSLGNQYLIILDDLPSVKKFIRKQMLMENTVFGNSSINLWKNCILLLQFPWLTESLNLQTENCFHRCKQDKIPAILKTLKTLKSCEGFNDCLLSNLNMNLRIKIGQRRQQGSLEDILIPRKNRKRKEFKKRRLHTFFDSSWKMLLYLSTGSGIQLSDNLRNLENIINSEVQNQLRNWNIFFDFVEIFMIIQKEAHSLKIEEEFKDTFKMINNMNCKIQQTIIEWLLLTMAAFKDVQGKIHEEIEEERINWTLIKYLELSHNHTIFNNQMSSLTYEQAAVLELLRWRPSFPLSVMGVTSSNIMLDKYFIPKDSLLVANTWSILHNYKCWGDDADEYNPERFLNQKGNLGAECLLFFFTGKRLLRNQAFAQADLMTNFLAILHKFNVSLLDGKSADMEGELHMSLQPKEQEIILTRKE